MSKKAPSKKAPKEPPGANWWAEGQPPPMMWWSPTVGLIVMLRRHEELKPVVVMEPDGGIGIGGRYLKGEPPADVVRLVADPRARPVT